MFILAILLDQDTTCAHTIPMVIPVPAGLESSKVKVAVKCWPKTPVHRLKSGLRPLVLGLVLLAAAPGTASDSGSAPPEMALSLDRALEIAAAENPRIAVARARKARAEGVRIRSRQGFSPRISLDATYLRLDTSVFDDISANEAGFIPLLGTRGLGSLEGQSVGVQLLQPLVNVGAWNARRQAGSALHAAELGLDRSRQEVDVAVIEAYFGALTAARQVEAEQKGLATARRALRQAEAGFEQELVAPVDVLSARTRVSEMQTRVATARARVVAGHSMLRRVLGVDGDVNLALIDSVPRPHRPESQAPVDQDLLSERRDLQAAEQGLEAAEHGVKRAQAAWLPEVNLYARYDKVEGNQPFDFDETGWLVAVNMRWKLFAGFGQVGALDEARAMQVESRARLRALRQQAWAEAQTAHAEWEAQFRGWRSASSGLLDAAEALALTEARYAEGLDDMTALLRAQAEELAARTREINARFNAVVAAERYRLAVSNESRSAPP